jgi:sugar phosphate isomerase/epimerase
MTAPRIGAAIDVADLAQWGDWIVADHRDLELQDFCEPEVIAGDWHPHVEEAKRRLDGYAGRLGIHGPFWGFTVDSYDPEVRAIVRKRLDQGLDVCAALGATHMVVHSPYTTWDGNNLDTRLGARGAMLERVHACLAPAAARAASQGVALVIENIEDTDPLDRLRLAQSLGEAVQVSLDTGHAHYAHVSTGAPPVDVFVRLAGERLAHVHLQDADGHADRHWALGQGTILWPGVFAALAECGAAPRLVLELADKRGIAASMAHLERLGLGR